MLDKYLTTTKHPIAIIGAGPIGLYLGLALHQAGIPFKIYEKRKLRLEHSRSIGIHPVSLELFKNLNLADQLIEHGLKIEKGHAYSTITEKIGTINFADLAKPFNFVLSIPQYRTEALLENKLKQLAPQSLHFGYELADISFKQPLNILEFKNGEKVETPLVIGCDGIRSQTRTLANIPFNGAPYPDRFIMADFPDNTNFGAEAVIFLHHHGLIESFPMPNQQRRWVIRLPDQYKIDEDKAELTRMLIREINARIDHDLSSLKPYLISYFGVQHYLAKHVYDPKGIILAGDAAHVVSPIGGQGMNLGWLDAARLTQTIQSIKMGEEAHRAFECYDRQTKRVADAGRRRSAFYMDLAKPRKDRRYLNFAISSILSSPLSNLAAKIFTMRGLERFGV